MIATGSFGTQEWTGAGKRKSTDLEIRRDFRSGRCLRCRQGK